MNVEMLSVTSCVERLVARVHFVLLLIKCFRFRSVQHSV